MKTPYQGRHKSFGEFECRNCNNSWMSASSWANWYQGCYDCGSKVYPWRQTKHVSKPGAIENISGYILEFITKFATLLPLILLTTFNISCGMLQLFIRILPKISLTMFNISSGILQLFNRILPVISLTMFNISSGMLQLFTRTLPKLCMWVRNGMRGISHH
ncbi:unnamed protein product [Meganyctiphanes norvegica]|uniref:Zinc finger domain-containing protein n=1 Tax=Meganyctiphanes norvegica TaxID=48144 RepID=A0AAV2RS83_MEGNR